MSLVYSCRDLGLASSSWNDNQSHKFLYLSKSYPAISIFFYVTLNFTNTWQLCVGRNGVCDYALTVTPKSVWNIELKATWHVICVRLLSMSYEVALDKIYYW